MKPFLLLFYSLLCLRGLRFRQEPPPLPHLRAATFSIFFLIFLTKIKVGCFFNFKSLDAIKIGSISLKLIFFAQKKGVNKEFVLFFNFASVGSRFALPCEYRKVAIRLC